MTPPENEAAPDPLPAEAAEPAPLSVSYSVEEPSRWTAYWRRIGGGSLTLSIALHAALLIAALVIFFQGTMVKPDEENSFLPGGGGGGKSSAADRIAKARATPMNMPRTRLASAASNSSVSLPDLQSSITDLSALSQPMMAGGGMGGGEGGLRGKGKGALFGDGIGSGIGNGAGKGFVSMPVLFGMAVDAKRMAVVLDVSGSMHQFLDTVIKEVDKVAPGAPIILNYGCGMALGPDNKRRADPVTDKDFDRDRIGEELRTSNAPGLAALYEKLKKRPATYFIPQSTAGTAWAALTDARTGEADAVYWFADFADDLNVGRLKEVATKMRGRRQKLYIHPSNPAWLTMGDRHQENVALVEETIVKPTGGRILNVDLTKVKAK